MWKKIRKTVSIPHDVWKICKIASTDQGITIGEVISNAIYEVHGRG